MTPAEPQPVRAHLGPWDAVSIMVGIVVGSGIYETPPEVFQNVNNFWQALGIWALAGGLCLCGALCYAELATAYPRSGGDYVYLARAYGRPAGFLFGWAQLALIQTASVGMMAYVFASYAEKLFQTGADTQVYYACAAIVVLGLFNLAGVVFGKSVQNILTAAKVLGLGGILVVGVAWAHPSTFAESLPLTKPELAENRLAWLAGLLVPVFLTYGGWNDMAFVAAELRERRDIPRALLYGTAGITLIYVLVNAAYALGLGLQHARATEVIAADVLKPALGDFGFKAMCLLVMVSALGAVNGLIFTSSRIYARLGEDSPLFARLAQWHPRLGTPTWSIVTLSAVSVGLVLLVGTVPGRELLANVLPGSREQSALAGRGGFFALLQCSAAIFWFFFTLTALALFVLRFRDPDVERPFRVPLYPIIPLIFLATCGYMLYGGIVFGKEMVLVGLAVTAVGIPLYLVSGRPAKA